jgi:hypothetical protein
MHGLYSVTVAFTLIEQSITIGLGQGAVDDRSIENHPDGYPPKDGPRETVLIYLFPDFQKNSPSIPDHYSNTPILHQSLYIMAHALAFPWDL